LRSRAWWKLHSSGSGIQEGWVIGDFKSSFWNVSTSNSNLGQEGNKTPETCPCFWNKEHWCDLLGSAFSDAPVTMQVEKTLLQHLDLLWRRLESSLPCWESGYQTILFSLIFWKLNVTND
jgi:hypothetical protein